VPPPTLPALCAAVAERRGVSALVAGASQAGARDVAARGCLRSTRFHVASVTKPVTAAIVSSVVALDAPAPPWAGVSVAQLLSHLSGRASELGELARFGVDDGALSRLAGELSAVPQLVAPGTCWSYANAGYWLAASIAEREAATTYEALVSAFCARIGLVDTDFGSSELATAPYARARRASGGLVSTVDDLLSLGEWLGGDDAAKLRVDLARTVRGVYGLGVAGERRAGRLLWGHGGSWGGFETSLFVAPEERLVVAVIAHGGEVRAACREIEDALLGAVAHAELELDHDHDVLERLAGRYANDAVEAEISVDGGRLVLTTAVEGSAAARAIGPATFEVLEGRRERSLFDFPLPGFIRIDSRLAARVQ